MKWLRKDRFRFLRGQGGFTLIETLVGTALLGVIGVALMSGLSTGYKSLAISQDRVVVEGLAKSQVEYIKSQEYISVANYPNDGPYEFIDIPAHLANVGYVVEIDPPEVVEFAGISGFELQRITIKVRRPGGGKLVVVFYRTGLAL